MLDVLDRTSESKGRFEKVRQLVAAGAEYDRVKALYPEYFPDALEEIRDNEGDYDIDALDDSKVEWSAPDDEGEDEELSAWIENRTRGSISGADL